MDESGDLVVDALNGVESVEKSATRREKGKAKSETQHEVMVEEP